MTHKQTGLENVNVGGDADINISQEIHHEPNKVADKVGILAQKGSTVNIENFNQIIQEAKRAGSLINLPQSNVTFFAGRDEALAKVHELLQQNQRVAVAAFVKGMGGIGKSELALQYGLRHLQDYGGGICWLRANEGNLPTQLQDFVVVQLGEKMPDGLDSGEKLAGYCWAQLGKSLKGQMLVVLDDVKDYTKVEPFLPPLDGNFRVLATTRLGLGNAMQQYTLDVLELAAAADLLKSFLHEADPRRQSEAEIEQLCEWLGRLPLAIELVGRYLARKPDLSITKMQERLETKKLQQDALTDKQRRALAEMTAKLNVIAAFDLSWQDLSEGAQRLGCLLSLFALAPIDWRWVIDAMGEDEEDLEAWRDDELLNLHLLERTGEEMYELHQLLREYFQFQLQQHRQWQALRQQVAVSLLNISKGIGQIITIDRVKEIAPAIPHLEILGRELLDHIPNPEEDLVWAFGGVGIFYYSQGLYSLAENSFLKALKITQEMLGEYNASLISNCNSLGVIYKLQGRYEEAETFLRKALNLSQSVLEGEHQLISQILNNLADLYRLQGRYAEAEPMFHQSLNLVSGILDRDSLTIRSNLALLYKSQGRYLEAEPLLKQVLLVRQKLLGESHPDVTASLNNLALLYKSQGRYSEAELLFQKSLLLRREILGEEHPDIADCLNNLATLCHLQCRYSEAEILYDKTLVLMQQLFGDRHPSVAGCLNNLAALYQLQGKYSEAEILFQRVLLLRQELLGNSHPDVAISLNNLAATYKSQSKYPEAEPLFQKSLIVGRKTLGERHPEVLGFLNNLADLFKLQGRYSEAEPLFREALFLRQESLGNLHPDVAFSLNNLATLYESQGRYEEADPLYQRALQICEKVLGVSCSHSMNIRSNYARCLKKWSSFVSFTHISNF